ncbi:hypothetical protein NQ318_021911 [Aromia moschata]|uniref:Protein Wnt n=1 Tax=Aromia moschata TaxID=1265417 RepID=A0AAV8Z866_9CUCU|nr:hypothetical protein NQ318_021911 [Aromia moschata]
MPSAIKEGLERSNSRMCKCAQQSKFKICTESDHIPVSSILEAQGAYLPLWANTIVLLAFFIRLSYIGLCSSTLLQGSQVTLNLHYVSKHCDKYNRY